MPPPIVSAMATPELLSAPHARRAQLIARMLDSGIDHAFIADHVSFRVGTGLDGLINAATLAALDPRLRIVVGVYLLALRHPIAVARQLSTLATAAPGQLILGVGVGGEDRNEFAMMGVDPRTRGRRTDEALEILTALANGEPLDHDGEFYRFERAWIRPAPEPRIPILIGGRSQAALARAARFGDGWLGVWCSPKRFGEAIAIVEGAKGDHAARDRGRGAAGYGSDRRERPAALKRVPDDRRDAVSELVEAPRRSRVEDGMGGEGQRRSRVEDGMGGEGQRRSRVEDGKGGEGQRRSRVEDGKPLHGLQLWVGIDRDKRIARERLANAMYTFYRLPYERFEKYSPFGTAEDVATFLEPYRAAGCRLFNVTAIAASDEAAIDAVAEIKARLVASARGTA